MRVWRIFTTKSPKWLLVSMSINYCAKAKFREGRECRFCLVDTTKITLPICADTVSNCEEAYSIDHSMQQIKLALLPLASIQLAPWIVKARNGLERSIRSTSTRCSSASLVSSNLLWDLQACILYGRVLVGRKGELAGRLFPEKLCIFLWTGLGNGYGDEVSVFRARRPRRWWLDVRRRRKFY